MKLKLLFTLFCILFAATTYAESQTNPAKTPTVTQPSTKLKAQIRAVPTPSYPKSSANNPNTPDMVSFCKEHTC